MDRLRNLFGFVLQTVDEWRNSGHEQNQPAQQHSGIVNTTRENIQQEPSTESAGTDSGFVGSNGSNEKSNVLEKGKTTEKVQKKTKAGKPQKIREPSHRADFSALAKIHDEAAAGLDIWSSEKWNGNSVTDEIHAGAAKAPNFLIPKTIPVISRAELYKILPAYASNTGLICIANPTSLGTTHENRTRQDRALLPVDGAVTGNNIEAGNKGVARAPGRRRLHFPFIGRRQFKKKETKTSSEHEMEKAMAIAPFPIKLIGEEGMVNFCGDDQQASAAHCRLDTDNFLPTADYQEKQENKEITQLALTDEGRSKTCLLPYIHGNEGALVSQSSKIEDGIYSFASCRGLGHRDMYGTKCTSIVVAAAIVKAQSAGKPAENMKTSRSEVAPQNLDMFKGQIEGIRNIDGVQGNHDDKVAVKQTKKLKSKPKKKKKIGKTNNLEDIKEQTISKGMQHKDSEMLPDEEHKINKKNKTKTQKVKKKTEIKRTPNTGEVNQMEDGEKERSTEGVNQMIATQDLKKKEKKKIKLKKSKETKKNETEHTEKNKGQIQMPKIRNFFFTRAHKIAPLDVDPVAALMDDDEVLKDSGNERLKDDQIQGCQMDTASQGQWSFRYEEEDDLGHSLPVELPGPSKCQVINVLPQRPSCRSPKEFLNPLTGKEASDGGMPSTEPNYDIFVTSSVKQEPLRYITSEDEEKEEAVEDPLIEARSPPYPANWEIPQNRPPGRGGQGFGLGLFSEKVGHEVEHTSDEEGAPFEPRQPVLTIVGGRPRRHRRHSVQLLPPRAISPVLLHSNPYFSSDKGASFSHVPDKDTLDAMFVKNTLGHHGNTRGAKDWVERSHHSNVPQDFGIRTRVGQPLEFDDLVLVDCDNGGGLDLNSDE